MRTAVVTDTNSGIYPEQARELGIWSMPMPVIINGETRYEGKDLTPEEFFRAQSSGEIITTSQPAPGDITALWDEILASGYDEIVYIPMTSGLSHSCESAQMLSASYGGRVRVADNHRISVTLRASVLEAKEMADEGMPALHIASDLELRATDASIYLTVETLDYLKKGGRVSPAAAALGTMLKIKPILTIQGGLLEPFAKERGLKKALDKMCKAVRTDFKKRFGGNMDDVVFAVAGAGLTPEQKEEVLSVAREAYKIEDVFYDELPLSIATHTGPGAIGTGIWRKRKA